MAEKQESAPGGIKLPKGAVEREKWTALIDRVDRLEKKVADLEKKGSRAK